MANNESDNMVSRARRAVVDGTKSDGFDVDTFKPSDVKGEYDRLVFEKRELEIELSRLNQSIQRAKAQAYHNKNFMPPAAWKRTQDRICELRSKIMQKERELLPLKAERRKLKDEYESSFDRLFRNVARELLAEPVYERVFAAAVHRAREEAESQVRGDHA
jgi:hypothetical protein